MDVLTRVSVEYQTLPGWCCSTEAARSFEELPPQAQDYIHFIEDVLQVPGLFLFWFGFFFKTLVLGVQTAAQPLALLLNAAFVSCPFWFQWSGSESANPGRAWSSCSDPSAELQVSLWLNFKYFTSKAVRTEQFCFRFPFIPQRTRLHHARLQTRRCRSDPLLSHTTPTGGKKDSRMKPKSTV